MTAPAIDNRISLGNILVAGGMIVSGRVAPTVVGSCSARFYL